MTATEELENIIDIAYLVIGMLADDCGRFHDDDVQDVLSMLSDRKINDEIIPFKSKFERQHQ